MKKKLRDKVKFARFCINHSIEPIKLAEVIDLIEASKRAWERDDNKAENTFADKVESSVPTIKARWKVKNWPGLYPMIVDEKGYEIHLPY